MAEPPLTDLVERLVRALGDRPVEPLRVSGLRGSAPALAVARLHTARRSPMLVLAARATDAEAFAADLRFFLGMREGLGGLARCVQYLPSWEVPPFEPISPTRETIAARAEGFHHLVQTEAPIVVTTVEAWMQRCLPRAVFGEAVTYVVAGEAIAPEALADRLGDWGYHRVPLVQDPGDLAVRGGILDVFPAGYTQPVRLEFVGDEVESLRVFDPSSQRSLDRLDDVLLLPIREVSRSRLTPEVARAVDTRAGDLGMARQERRELVEAVRNGFVLPGTEVLLPYLYDALGTLADFVPPATILWMLGAAEIETAIETVWFQVTEHAAAAAEAGRFHPEPEALYLAPPAVRAALATFRTIEVEGLEMLAGETLRVTTHSTEALALRTAPGPDGPLGPVVKRLVEWRREGTRLVLVAPTDGQRDRLIALFGGHGLEVVTSGAPFPQALEYLRGPTALAGELTRGTWIPEDQLAIVTEAELLGERRSVRRARRVAPANFLSMLAELKPSDFVVHVDHGIGRYHGLRHMNVADTEGDFLHLEYLDGDRMYVPVDRIDVVQRYVGAGAAEPALDKLGGTSWERVKAKTKESLLAMANELLRVYATRETHTRESWTSADGLYEEFVARFPFEETEGQTRAITEVLGDLATAKPMDRLVCGDVGFGKTEVAMRAAFLAVMGGKQVAVLVPTTILAQQHQETFKARFAEYPVQIATLSRFRSPAENKVTVEALANGTVDIVIGTHRLLQQDIQLQRLGLLIVDEEHRFGVKDKERIRKLRATVDVLTLTATPIPRTLNMALSGIRDLSVIETPPVDRLAIRTYVTKYDEAVIRDAILREVGRGGQVFFVHNRVESIDAIARRLGDIVPEATFLVVHGQLGEAELERRMLAFMHGEANVLVTSAIIESGLDIPRANTILVNRADTFGLAQLYQIRGRVGRSHHRAYAYLLIPGEHLITPDAQKRLHVLQELDDLGSGFRLAAHDLEIRGAGNLLGKEQSGTVNAVGLELYTHMLEQAVRELRGEQAEADLEPEIQIGIPAFIPESYVPDVHQRLLLYKRLASIRGIPDVEVLGEELADRYGPLPAVVDTLLHVMELRGWLKDLRIARARRRGQEIAFEFDPSTPIQVEQLLALVRNSRGALRMASGTALLVTPKATDHDGLVAELREHLRALAGAC